MKPNTPKSQGEKALLELRDALALIDDFYAVQESHSRQARVRLADLILRIDRRFGDIQSY